MSKENVWRDCKITPPPQRGKYLCCYLIGNASVQVRVARYAPKLSDVDTSDFKGIDRPGWYSYDGEWGYYELEDISHWAYLPTLPDGEEVVYA